LRSKPQRPDATHLEPGVAPCITFWPIFRSVAVTVDLDRKLRLIAIEVEDIGPDGMLASNPEVVELPIAQPFPEQSFGQAHSPP
jgi:hypothetical protein